MSQEKPKKENKYKLKASKGVNIDFITGLNMKQALKEKKKLEAIGFWVEFIP